MLSQYKNIDKILSSTKATQGQRFLDKSIDLFSSPALKYAWKNNILTDAKYNGIELHVYSGDIWITGNHRIDLQSKNQVTFTNPVDNVDYRLPAKPWQINLFEEFNELGIQKGEYRIAVNFFTNLIGSYESQKLKIDEISPDRTELRLRSIDPDDSEFLEQITDYIQNVGNSVERLTSTSSYRTLLVNFSRNQTALFTNSVVIGEYVYVKLYEPLSDDIEKDFKCWIVEEQRPTYIDRVTIETFGLGITEPTRKLAGPNWDASDRASTSTDTGLKNWNDILGSSVTTSQQLVDSIFSGSLSGIDLNIDYSDFNNFVFYSSATERVKNFHYKIELIEYYNSQLNTLSSISGSTAVTNIEEFTNLKNSLIGGFDEFEKYLYFNSSSTPFTYDLPLADPNVSYLTGSYVDPWPKTTTSRPHTLYNSTSSIAQTWYSTLLENADLYDRANYNSLINGVPLYLRTNPDNEGLETFIHMLGHHYDIIYTYIRNVSKIYSRDEHPKYGVPNELLYSVAKQFGWSLTDGNQYKDLWEYVLGTNEAGIPITGSNTVGDASLPGKDMTYHVWRRIVNNLPGLLKSKGTKRSVKALLSCYGIPQSMISINEYGGPRLERPPVYEKLNFDYALDLIQNAAGTVTVNYDQPINSVELRFRTDNVLENPALPSTMNLFSVDSNDVTLDFTRGTLGTIQINGTSSADIEMFDGGWLNVLLRSGSNASLEVVAKKSKYGKIVAAVSASATASFASTGTVTLGGTSGGARLQGQLQELRLWTSSLQDSPFNNHTKAPAAYDGNVDAYDELVFRLPLTEKTDHTTAVTMSGVEPNLSGITASFASWTNAEPYDSIEETYYYDGISLAAGTFDDNKIRLEDNELVGTLDVKSRAERSQFDKAPLDSNRLGVYFSPQTMINEDIIAQLGFTELDSYIGDPGQQYERSYPDLIEAARRYWKKYETKNDLNAYIKIFTLFDLSFFKQLDQLLPARADKITGLLIQPNILERNKDSFVPKIQRKDVAYNSELDINNNTILSANRPQYEIPLPISIIPSGVSDDYFSVVDANFLSLSSQNDGQYVAFLTRSSAEKYDGYAGTLFQPITSSITSTTRESVSYIEYRKRLYDITWPIESSSISVDFRDETLTFAGGIGFDPAVETGGEQTDVQDATPTLNESELTSIWTTTNNISYTTWDIVPSGSNIPVAISSSISASLSATLGDRLIQFTGYDVRITRWGDGGGVGGIVTDERVYINNEQLNFSFDRTGSSSWDTSSVYPAGGTQAIYGNPNYGFTPGGVDVNTYLNDLIFTKTTYTTMSIVTQPFIDKNDISTAGVDIAWARIDEIRMYYEYSGSAITGSIPTGYVVVSGSDILTNDLQGQPAYGVEINIPAQVQDFIGTGAENSFYNGSKMTSRGFNIASPDTIDGGPVVETRQSNPNQLIYQAPGENGSFTLSRQ